ncbi:lysine N(6)-hydroxylase/L-ornithine N(5)-oxygenase family protein [Halobacteria archaeon AArc-curdl1]|uniref:Lysine N(6)-hydroxylase/L-ornithine N(5)-oxygenase family protein n=1 Tax=Natronosalvus hydrolyticus TaxID=2979988 RepID=A0AAP2ZAG3_9EURY|nr:lysine N(6)-hydroxylase/L-ornithine N(5)-oxygenase family protein [Halobacteria archaeon AArc-curdl1]
MIREANTDFAITIVGGGIHGVHLAVRLLEADMVDLQSLAIIDPTGLLEAFRRKCEQCGMAELRSPYVHHVDTDPFSLRDFARARGREDELVPSTVGAERPTTSLFFDHAGWVCDRYDLESALVNARVTAVDPGSQSVEIETTVGRYCTEYCLLATGHGGSFTFPAWATDLLSTEAVTHVWDTGFAPESIGQEATVGIVGGSITAAQLATTLAQPGREVVLFARSPFRVEALEASTDWMHFTGVGKKLQEHPPASRVREELVAKARYDGTMPPYVFRRLKRALERQSIELERSDISVATEAGGTVVVTCQDGSAFCLDKLICATGFGSPYESDLFQQHRQESTLQTGYRGAPALEDETLRWLHQDGTPSRISVSGVGAQQVLGPFARNVIGARRAGELIVDSLEANLELESQRAKV